LGADVHAKNLQGCTPLFAAAFKGSAECVDLLIGKGKGGEERDERREEMGEKERFVLFSVWEPMSAPKICRGAPLFLLLSLRDVQSALIY
jgi:hypothetical protein